MALPPAEIETQRDVSMRQRQAWAMLRQGCALEAPYRHEQSQLIQRRVRSLALVIALLAIAWIPIDLVGLRSVEFMPVALLRVLLSGFLVALALNVRRLPPLLALASFIALQCLGFAAMQVSLLPGEPGMLRVGYGLFPFLVTVELAIFPLSWACTLGLALPIALLVVGPLASGDLRNGPELWNLLWLLVLLLVLAAWTSNSQLSLMRELLHARRDANHDALTGLFNRRAAMAQFSLERARALRERAPLSVLMIDIDLFKRINDRWGHAAGDRVLLALADALLHELREVDLAVRHGGEEFLVILPATSGSQAFDIAERIRNNVAQLAVPLEDKVESITVSIGIATFDGVETNDELIARADAALYRAKQNGRNRTVAAKNLSAEDVLSK